MDNYAAPPRSKASLLGEQGWTHRGVRGNVKGPQLAGLNLPVSQNRPQIGGSVLLGWAGLCSPKKFLTPHKALIQSRARGVGVLWPSPRELLCSCSQI